MRVGFAMSFIKKMEEEIEKRIENCSGVRKLIFILRYVKLNCERLQRVKL